MTQIIPYSVLTSTRAHARSSRARPLIYQPGSVFVENAYSIEAGALCQSQSQGKNCQQLERLINGRVTSHTGRRRRHQFGLPGLPPQLS
jgi:hypothetical protein